MCSIIGSFDKDTIVDLCELNAYRGQHSHSISYFDIEHNDFFMIQKSFGPINYDKIDIPDNHYCIVHMQAPTTDNTQYVDNIHPAMYERCYLWHNGIIKEKEIARLRAENDIESTWDTYILLQHLINKGTPEGIDGTFSCLYYDGYRMYLFRNEISPMFIDKKFNISSTKFKGSQATEPNALLLFEPAIRSIKPVLYFNTVENPYYFGDA